MSDVGFNIDDVADELCQILDKERDSVRASESSKERVKEIGRQLNQTGGFELMQRVINAVIARRSSGYELINAWWSGIGEWRY